MDKIEIVGGQKLQGSIRISGAKNAALPLMACALLTAEPVVLQDVPELADIRTMQKVLEHFGMKITRNGTTMTLQADNITQFEAPYELVSTMRASFWVLGPLVGRFGQARVSMPGGCAIGVRAVDRHLYVVHQLGANIDMVGGYVECQAKDGLKGTQLSFGPGTLVTPFYDTSTFKPSVGATMNALMASVLAKGRTEIDYAAIEPEVTDLANCLVSMGAKISGIGTPHLVIEGVERLHGTTYAVISDRVEASTYAIAAAITQGQLTLTNIKAELLQNVLDVLTSAGVNIHTTQDSITVSNNIWPLKPVYVTTKEYPGFPTDDQAQLMALMTLAAGESSITETIYENRFMHVPELVRMGAHIQLKDKNTAVIKGVDRLIGAPVMASDLRASAALILAGLAAQGTTTVHRVYHLDRGYDNLVGKLQACGANIKRLPENN